MLMQKYRVQGFQGFLLPGGQHRDHGIWGLVMSTGI